MLLYSDGFIEHENNYFNELTPEKLILNPSLIETAKEKTQHCILEDDVTLLYLENTKNRLN